jgi:hypothetical protein
MSLCGQRKKMKVLIREPWYERTPVTVDLFPPA